MPSRAGLRVVEDRQRCRPRWAWALCMLPALPPRAPPLDPCHKLLHASIPRACLKFQRGRSPRRCGHGDVPAPTQKNQAEMSLGHELQFSAAGATGDERLLERFARRQRGRDVVPHRPSLACAALGSAQGLPLWGRRSTLGEHGGDARAASSLFPYWKQNACQSHGFP
jgi:hypothetical protein